MPGVPMVSSRVSWIQFNGPPEFVPASIEVPIEPIQDECKRVVGFTERVIQLESMDRRSFRFGERLLGGHHRILPVSQ